METFYRAISYQVKTNFYLIFLYDDLRIVGPTFATAEFKRKVEKNFLNNTYYLRSLSSILN